MSFVLLKVSNERLTALAIEMDEQSNKQEETMHQEKIKIEQKYQEQIRIMKKSNEIEIDIKNNLIEEQNRYILLKVYSDFNKIIF